jgi:hypothetical protein
MADQNTRVNILPSCIFIPKTKNNFYYFLVIVIKYYLILLAKRKPHRSGVMKGKDTKMSELLV